MTFTEMLKIVRTDSDLTQADIGKALGYSTQYICDLELGRRMPSVQFINRMCKWMGRGPVGRRKWHEAGARAHGWEI